MPYDLSAKNPEVGRQLMVRGESLDYLNTRTHTLFKLLTCFLDLLQPMWQMTMEKTRTQTDIIYLMLTFAPGSGLIESLQLYFLLVCVQYVCVDDCHYQCMSNL